MASHNEELSMRIRKKLQLKGKSENDGKQPGGTEDKTSQAGQHKNLKDSLTNKQHA